MDKLRNRLRLLALLNIYYVYKVITSFLANDLILEIVWTSVTVLYSGALITYYFMKKKTQKRLSELKKEGQSRGLVS